MEKFNNLNNVEMLDKYLYRLSFEFIYSWKKHRKIVFFLIFFLFFIFLSEELILYCEFVAAF